MSGRCVLASAPIKFAEQALRERRSGTVTLTGIIDRDGTVAGVHVATASVAPVASTNQLVGDAVANVKTWWVEPASHQDRFRMTYTYLIDPSIQRGQDVVQFALPDRITIRAGAR
jgi:TonB family protein